MSLWRTNIKMYKSSVSLVVVDKRNKSSVLNVIEEEEAEDHDQGRFMNLHFQPNKLLCLTFLYASIGVLVIMISWPCQSRYRCDAKSLPQLKCPLCCRLN